MSEKISPQQSSSFDRLKVTFRKRDQEATERSNGGQPQDSVRIALDKSASDNTSAAGFISTAADVSLKDGTTSEVAKANEASSRASVRDVERAASLARTIATRISTSEDEALGAFKEPAPERVKDLLS